MNRETLLLLPVVGSLFLCFPALAEPLDILEHYCFDCHDDATKKGGLDLAGLVGKENFDGTLMFENLVTGKMPPAEKDQPSDGERKALLGWLAAFSP